MPAKRCPMCHRASENTAWQCACGYEFGTDIETVRGMLRTQLRHSWLVFSLFVVLDLALVAIAVVGAALTPIFALAALLGGTLRSLRKILVSRESLRQLAPAELPSGEAAHVKHAALLLVVAACAKDKAAPPAKAKVVPPGPYIVSYDCDHSNAPFGKGGAVDHQSLDLGAKTRTTLAYNYADAPIAPPAPVIGTVSDTLVMMTSDAVTRVLAGGPYKPELPRSEGYVCVLTIAKGGQTLLRIEKADTKETDAVSELVHVFRP